MEEKETNCILKKKYSKGTRELAVSSIRGLPGEKNERKFRLSFSSEEPFKRYWGVEILDHKETSINMERLNSIGCVLFNHNRDKVVGKVTKAWIENSRGEAEIEFDTDTEAETIFQKVKNGTLKGVSIGYSVSTWEEVAVNEKSSDGRFTGPCDIATNWMPYEISIVSVPADSTVGVERAMENKNSNLNLLQRQVDINKNLLGGSYDN